MYLTSLGNAINWRDFLNQPNPVASALMAKMNIAEKERAKVKAECLRLLITLKLNPAKMQLISGFIDTYSNSWSYEVQWKANRQIIELTSFL
ncbi:putative cytoplasmic protein [Microcystis aeruginosa 11-30S32]|uniref:Putative cytoplasmic protein n=1 Tax=Microcystis aeruginosa 11-30S32 TaxID=2358142 RepID=A0A510PQQ8_MICAE|nr:putative cytoplasmic protein [Microcystis aeruginosa 11-30S32]